MFPSSGAATENDRRPDEKKLVVDERREWEEVYGWSISRKDMVEEKHQRGLCESISRGLININS